MFNRTLVKRRSQVTKVQTRWCSPGTTGLLAISVHLPTPCEQISQYAPHKSLLNCHLLVAPPGLTNSSWGIWGVQSSWQGASPKEPIKTGGAASYAQSHKDKCRLPILKNKTTTKQTNKIPWGQKEVLCCHLCDRIESPNHKHQKKKEGWVDEGWIKKTQVWEKHRRGQVTVGNHMLRFCALWSAGKWYRLGGVIVTQKSSKADTFSLKVRFIRRKDFKTIIRPQGGRGEHRMKNDNTQVTPDLQGRRDLL